MQCSAGRGFEANMSWLGGVRGVAGTCNAGEGRVGMARWVGGGKMDEVPTRGQRIVPKIDQG